MLQGKVCADESSQNDILPSSPEVIDLLKKKQSPAEPTQHETLIQSPLSHNVDFIHFASIDEQAIHKAAMHTKGSCSPSHVISVQFRHIIYSGHLKAEGKVLEAWLIVFLKIEHDP